MLRKESEPCKLSSVISVHSALNKITHYAENTDFADFEEIRVRAYDCIYIPELRKIAETGCKMDEGSARSSTGSPTIIP